MNHPKNHDVYDPQLQSGMATVPGLAMEMQTTS